MLLFEPKWFRKTQSETVTLWAKHLTQTTFLLIDVACRFFEKINLEIPPRFYLKIDNSTPVVVSL